MREYSLKFSKLSKYIPFMVAYPKACMSKLIFNIQDLVSKQHKMTMLVKEMDIFRLIIYAEKIKKEKRRDRVRESKRSRVDGGGYYHQGSGSHNKLRCVKNKATKVFPTLLLLGS